METVLFMTLHKKDKFVSNLDKLNEKMLAAYNRCGGGPNGTDEDDDQPSKGNLSTVNDFHFKSKCALNSKFTLTFKPRPYGSNSRCAQSCEFGNATMIRFRAEAIFTPRVL